MKKANNKLIFILLAIFLVFLILIFGYFIYRYINMDKNTYQVSENSVLYTNNLEYIKVSGTDSYLQEKIDGNYYLYETIDGSTKKYKIGQNAIIYKENDPYVYLYGKAYQVLDTGDLVLCEKETQIQKTNPTKIFKLADRKYVMVDSTIKSTNTNSIDTTGYLYIELDKAGNATFANQEMNFKSLKPEILTGTYFDFNIAEEILTFDEETFNLKNIIGSTNTYKKKENKVIVDSSPKVEEETTEKEDTTNNSGNSSNNSGGGSNGTAIDVNYYDNYLNSIITGYNNLASSVNSIAEGTKTIANQSNNTYYDFNKWVALKGVEAGSSSITISYSVFDPNSEYDAVYITVINSDDSSNTYYLNKNNTSYEIRGLTPGNEYNLEFGYKTNSSVTGTVADEIVVKTKAADYNLTVYKIEQNKVINSTDTKYTLYYKLQTDLDYTLSSANLVLYCDGDKKYTKEITSDDLNVSGVLKGEITLNKNESLGIENILKIEDVQIIDEENGSSNYDGTLKVSYKFYSE